MQVQNGRNLPYIDKFVYTAAVGLLQLVSSYVIQ